MAFLIVYLPMFVNGFFDLKWHGHPWAFVLDATYFVVIPLATFTVVTLDDGRSMLHGIFSEFGPIKVSAIGWGLLFGFLFAAGEGRLLEVLISIQDRWNTHAAFRGVDVFQPTMGWTMVIYGAVTAGIVEEILYKPVLKRALPVTTSNRAYVLAATALFAAAHFEQGWWGTSMAATFGLVSSAYYKGGGSLITLVAAHFIADIMIFASR